MAGASIESRVPADDPTQAALIVAMILEGPTCLDCLAAKVGPTPRDVARALEWIANTLRFHAQARAYCGLCDLTVGPVYWIARPVEARDPAAGVDDGGHSRRWAATEMGYSIT